MENEKMSQEPLSQEEQGKEIANKETAGIRERIDQGKISREITIENLLEGDPTKDRMYGRLEAYLQTGVLIDQNDLMKIVEQYELTVDEINNLAKISHIGITEGMIQEPDNVRNLGVRTGCFSALSERYFEMTKKE